MSFEYLRRQPVLGEGVFIVKQCTILGDVELGDYSSVWYNAVIRGDICFIRIGASTNIQDGAILHVTPDTFPLRIGTGVTVGHRAMLHGCTIEDYCLIGMSATVLDGAMIGPECLVAAGAVVLENSIIPPRSLVAGVPAQVKRQLTVAEVQELHDTADLYRAYAAEYQRLGIE
ncbi:MAG: gamma carbonic anhydrase family protein [Candidatus Delongbacteria bacterium]|nr:gamma carbonic anhydrase family protein [Candidatus Delongbacteria bacterium]